MILSIVHAPFECTIQVQMQKAVHSGICSLIYNLVWYINSCTLYSVLISLSYFCFLPVLCLFTLLLHPNTQQHLLRSNSLQTWPLIFWIFQTAPAFSNNVCPSALHVPPMTTTPVLHSPTPLQHHIRSTTALHSVSPSQHHIESTTAMAPKQVLIPVTMKRIEPLHQKSLN